MENFSLMFHEDLLNHDLWYIELISLIQKIVKDNYRTEDSMLDILKILTN
jgi:hypothetical protein